MSLTQPTDAAGTTPVDPVTFEIIRHKLLRVTDETIIALENVSGSPITNEGHDMMASLYGPDGGLMVGGVGFLHHLTSAAQAVKHIIATFGDDPGIDEDDVFFFNDSYTAALHPPDVYMISPIHYRGELTGFVANFVHVTDIGAVDPGGFSPNAVDNYQEGFQTKGLKIVERGKMRRDIVDTFLNLVRDPGMTQLDIKSQLAANHVAKERMRRIYADCGVEAVQAVSAELITQSERLVRQRLRELPDGSWRVREYVDLPHDTCRVELTVTKAADTLTYDFTGTSPEASLGINCCYWATWGAMFAPIFPLLAWDVTWNEGVARPISLIAPEGSLVNCRRPAPISIATVGCVQIVNNLSTLALSKMFGASDLYRDRATAVWHGSHAHVETHGLTPDGEFFIAPLTDTFGGSGGARPRRGDPQCRVAMGQRGESGVEHAPRVSLPPCRDRFRGGGKVPRRRLPRVRVRTGARRFRARPHSVRERDARTDEPRSVRWLPGLQCRLCDLPRRQRQRAAPPPRCHHRPRA
jgi:N-methylhydantoinase B